MGIKKKKIFKVQFKNKFGKTILRDDIFATSKTEARKKFLAGRIKIKRVKRGR